MVPIKRVLVLGGTGFIGREICRRAIQLGFSVTSLSRRGRICGSYLSAEDVRGWESKVTWSVGNALDAGVVGPLISRHDAVVHSIGIFLQSSLNQSLSGNATNAVGITYAEANRDTVMLLYDFITSGALVPLRMLALQERGKLGTRPFAFISAAAAYPFPRLFLETKYEVEAALQKYEQKKKLRSVIFRPGIVYHHYKWSSLPISRLTTYAFRFDQFCDKNLRFSLGLAEPTPLDLLATSILRAIAVPTTSGVMTNEDMWALAERRAL